MNPVARMILIGTKDPASPLHILENQTDVLQDIWTFVLESYLLERLLLDKWIHKEGVLGADDMPPDSVPLSCFKVGKCGEFPPSTGLYCNMMPFRLYSAEDSLPKEYHAYLPIIYRMLRGPRQKYFRRNANDIGYLTIHESTVMPGHSQRYTLVVRFALLF
jgi:hypothetical protein